MDQMYMNILQLYANILQNENATIMNQRGKNETK